MFDNSVINVVTGLIFIFMLYSLFATAVQEAIANLLQRRANMLSYGIRCMFTNTVNNSNISKIRLILYYLFKSATNKLEYLLSLFIKKKADTLHDRFYNHPIIKNYGQNSLFNKPSYIGAQNFSTILIDTLKNIDGKNENQAATIEMIEEILKNYKQSEKDTRFAVYQKPASETQATKQEDVKKKSFWIKLWRYMQGRDIDLRVNKVPKLHIETLHILNYHLSESGKDLDVFRHRLEQWFDDTMARVTGWYKKNTHYWLFGIGLFLAVTLNIDTIAISNYLSKNKSAAEQLAKMGEAAANSGRGYSPLDSTITKSALDSIKKDMQQVNTIVGLGWSDYGRTNPEFIKKLKAGKCWTLWDKWVTDTAGIADSIDRLAAQLTVQRDSLDSTLKQNKSDWLALKKAEDSAKVRTLSAALAAKNTQLAIYRTKSDSIANVLLYDRIAEDHPFSMKAAYIGPQLYDMKKLFGFLITAIAIGLGAPFWYDLLNKIVSLRAAGKNATSTTTSTSDKEKADG